MISSSAILTSLLCFKLICPSADQDRELRSIVITTPQSTGIELPNNSKDTFSITMPDINWNEEDIAEKNKQFRISAGLTTAVAGLTLYYACTTEPKDWLSGTMGSFCTNTVLTAAATCFLRRDRNILVKRLKNQEK